MMPLPLFFHLAIISWRKLDSAKLPASLWIPTYSATLVSEAASASPLSPPLVQLLRHAGVVFAQWVDRKCQWPGDAFGSVRDFVSSCWGYKLRGRGSSYPIVKWTPWESNASGICFVCPADIKEMTASWILKACKRGQAPLGEQRAVFFLGFPSAVFCFYFFKGELATAAQWVFGDCGNTGCVQKCCVCRLQ